MANLGNISGQSLLINPTGNGTGYQIGTISVTGTITGGNLRTAANIDGANLRITGTISAVGNITSGNILTAGTISATGTVRGGNLSVGSGFVSAGNIISTGPISTSLNISATGNIQAGNLRTVGVVSATGNITGNYFIGNGSQLTGITSQLSGNMSGNINANLYAIQGASLFSGANLVVQTANVFGTLTVSGGKNVVVSNVARQIWVSNISPTSSDGNVGDIWYQTF